MNLSSKQAIKRGNAGYQGARNRLGAKEGVACHAAIKPGRCRAPRRRDSIQALVANRLGHINARGRARVEHSLRVIKQQFGLTKVRYCGLTQERGSDHDAVRAGRPAAGARTLIGAQTKLGPPRNQGPADIDFTQIPAARVATDFLWNREIGLSCARIS